MYDLFHASYQVIEDPDIHHGRKNADLGQGFYTTDDRAFANRWVRESPGKDIVINHYELDDRSLKVKKFERNKEWFDYIFANRRLKPDAYEEYDLIIGPIANDTIYETFGIITSGYLTDQEAMELLMVGPCSYQIVLKTQKAADNLKFINSEILSKDKIIEGRREYEKENKAYQIEFARVMEEE
nr:DUF3990 domain-containing protein [uncultured Butyrivibrio sp.]